MKNINVTFTDEEHEVLVKAKGDLNWHDFILRHATKETKRDGNKQD